MAQVPDRVLTQCLAALSQRDFERLESFFDPSVKFRALIPPGFREASGSSESVGYFRQWFGDADTIEVLDSQIDQLRTRSRLAYRLRVREDGKWYIVAQQMFCTVGTSTIKDVDLLCSGFIPESG